MRLLLLIVLLILPFFSQSQPRKRTDYPYPYFLTYYEIEGCYHGKLDTIVVGNNLIDVFSNDLKPTPYIIYLSKEGNLTYAYGYCRFRKLNEYNSKKEKMKQQIERLIESHQRSIENLQLHLDTNGKFETDEVISVIRWRINDHKDFIDELRGLIKIHENDF